jgi:hypothetical protein
MREFLRAVYHCCPQFRRLPLGLLVTIRAAKALFQCNLVRFLPPTRVNYLLSNLHRVRRRWD